MADIALNLLLVAVIVFIAFAIILLICASIVVIKITKEHWRDKE